MNFLTENLSSGLHENILKIQNEELMIAAGIGNEEMKDTKQKNTGR